MLKTFPGEFFLEIGVINQPLGGRCEWVGARNLLPIGKSTNIIAFFIHFGPPFDLRLRYCINFNEFEIFLDPKL